MVKDFVSVKILILSLLLFSVACKKRNKVYISSYKEIENIENENTPYDYHVIQFYQNSLPFDIAAEMNYLSSIPDTALFRIGDDDATYPQKDKSAIPITQTDIPSSSSSLSSIKVFEKLLPSFDMKHSKCYVAWDITQNEIQINASPLVKKFYYQTKIKYFNSLNTMNQFYNRISSAKKISRCGLKPENTIFKYRINNLEFEVSKVFPLLLNYYNCAPDQYLSLATPISNSRCLMCPSNTRTNDDQISCVALKNSKYLILSYISKTQLDASNYSVKLHSYPTDDYNDAVIKYTNAPEPKLLIDNQLKQTLFYTGSYDSDAGSDTLNSLYSYPFYPEILTPINGQAGSGECSSSYPYFYKSVYKIDEEIVLDIRFGNNIYYLNMCYVWLTDKDKVVEPSFTNFGNYIKNSDYNPSDPSNDYEAEINGICNLRISGNFRSFVGPQNQYMDDFTIKSFPGDYYVSLEIKLDPTEFAIGEGLEFTSANHRSNGSTPTSINSSYGVEAVFHVKTLANGDVKIGCDRSAVYAPFEVLTGTPGTIPAATAAKWYKFKHRYHNNSGTLFVTMSIVSDDGAFNVTCGSFNLGPVANFGGARNYRFTSIHKGVANQTQTDAFFGISQSAYLKIRNFKYIIENDPVISSEALNNKCDAIHTRGYYCRSLNPGTLPKTLEYKRHYSRDKSNFELYFQKYNPAPNVNYSYTYIKEDGF